MLSIKSEYVVVFEIHMDIEKVCEDILKCDNVNLAVYPLTHPGRCFCPHNELLDISFLSNALISTKILLLLFYGAPTPFRVIACEAIEFLYKMRL
jgi:hypothetical protein